MGDHEIERDDEGSFSIPAGGLVRLSSLATLIGRSGRRPFSPFDVFAARVGSSDPASHIGRRLTQRNGRGGYACNEPNAKPEFPQDRLDGAEGWITFIGL